MGGGWERGGKEAVETHYENASDILILMNALVVIPFLDGGGAEVDDGNHSFGYGSRVFHRQEIQRRVHGKDGVVMASLGSGGVL